MSSKFIPGKQAGAYPLNGVSNSNYQNLIKSIVYKNLIAKQVTMKEYT